MSWIDRENERFANGDYTKLPWDDLIPIENHFCHVAKGGAPGMVSYTANNEAGEKDIHVRLKAGKYLHRFYPHMSNEKVRHYATLVQTIKMELKFAETIDDATRVYHNGPRSCMSDRKGWQFLRYRWMFWKNLPKHPVAAYYGGDLKVAYIGTIDKPEARAIVCQKTKKYIRIYGNIVLMENLLYLNGYHHDYNIQNGAKINVYQIDKHRIIMPFVDSTNGYISVYNKQLYFGNIFAIDSLIKLDTRKDKAKVYYVNRTTNGILKLKENRLCIAHGYATNILVM